MINKGKHACQHPKFTALADPKEFFGRENCCCKADEAAGLAPSNKENNVSGNFNLEKPY